MKTVIIKAGLITELSAVQAGRALVTWVHKTPKEAFIPRASAPGTLGTLPDDALRVGLGLRV